MRAQIIESKFSPLDHRFIIFTLSPSVWLTEYARFNGKFEFVMPAKEALQYKLGDWVEVTLVPAQSPENP